jgi:hypothetical protein
MAGTIRGVNATTVFWANSRKVNTHSIAVDCTSSSRMSAKYQSANPAQRPMQVPYSPG